MSGNIVIQLHRKDEKKPVKPVSGLNVFAVAASNNPNNNNNYNGDNTAHPNRNRDRDPPPPPSVLSPPPLPPSPLQHQQQQHRQQQQQQPQRLRAFSSSPSFLPIDPPNNNLNDNDNDRRRDFALDSDDDTSERGELRRQERPADRRTARDGGRLTLTDEEDETLHKILASITQEREDILHAMVFAIDHAYAAESIISALHQTFLRRDQPAAQHVARLYLVSDILHNSQCTVRNASAYRSGFQKILPDIVQHLHEVLTLLSNVGRLSSNSFKDSVMQVLKTWQAWLLYPESFVNSLVKLFLSGELPCQSYDPGNSDGGGTNDNGSPNNQVQVQEPKLDEQEEEEEEDIDGVPLDNYDL